MIVEEQAGLSRLLRLLLGVLADGHDVGGVGEEAAGLVCPLDNSTLVTKGEGELWLPCGGRNTALGLISV